VLFSENKYDDDDDDDDDDDTSDVAAAGFLIGFSYRPCCRPTKVKYCMKHQLYRNHHSSCALQLARVSLSLSFLVLL